MKSTDFCNKRICLAPQIQIFFGGLNQKRPLLVCAKSIFTLILKVSDKFIEKYRRSRLFGE